MNDKDVARYDDGQTRFYLRTSYKCTIFSTDGDNLVAIPAITEVVFLKDPHTSHLLLTVSINKRTIGASKIMTVAKLRIPAQAMKSMQLGDIEAILREKENANEARSKIPVPWMLSIKFNVFQCAVEGVNTSLTGSDNPCQKLKDVFRTNVLETTELHIRIEGGEGVLIDFDKLQKAFNEELATDLLKKWFPNSTRYQFQIGQILGPEHRPSYVSEPVYSFANFNDYAVRLGFGQFQEREYVTNYIKPTQAFPAEAILIQSVGTRTRGLFALISRNDDEDAFRLSLDDTVEILFGTDVRKTWVGKVVPPIPYQPHGWTLVFISPWNKDESYHFLKLEELGDHAQTQKALLNGQKLSIVLKRQVSDKTFKRHVNSLELFMKIHQRYTNKKSRETFAPTTAQLRDLTNILNNHVQIPERVNAYVNVEGEGEDMNLVASQMLVFEDLKNAIGGWTVVQGPPGTGKTHTVTQCAIPFLKSKDNHPLLYTSTTNKGVDDMARKLQKIVEKLQEKGMARNKYIVRAHSAGIEGQVMGKKYSNPKVYRPEAVEDSLLQTLEGVRVLHCKYENVDRKYENTNNKRVSELQLSIGFRMLQVLNLAPIAEGTEILDPKPHYGCSELYRRYLKGDDFDRDAMKHFREQLTDLRVKVIKNAAAVVATVDCAGSYYMYSAMENPALIVIDEAARALEIDLLSLFVFYPNCTSKLFVGDIWQLRPVMHTRQLKHNQPGRNFADQGYLSLQHRLAMTNFNIITLNEQFRAVRNIARVYNQITYGGILIDAPCTNASERPLFDKMKTFNLARYEKYSNIIFLDVPKGEALYSVNNSQYNEVFCQVGLNLVNALLQEDFMKDNSIGHEGKPRIGVLMGYHAQWLCYTSGQDRMALTNPEARDVDFDKIDARQGDEWDIVIIDLTITAKVGFMREINRLNVLFSRARCAVYLIGNKQRMDQLTDRGNHWFREFYCSYLPYLVVVDVEPCPWFNIGQVDVSAAKDDGEAENLWGGRRRHWH